MTISQRLQRTPVARATLLTLCVVVFMFVFATLLGQLAIADVGPVAPAAATVDVDLVTKLWRSGMFVDVGVVVAYLGLGLALKIDKRHAFYISAALAAVTVVLPAAVAGDTPSLSMVLGALSTLVAILVKGPGAPPT